MLRERKLSKEQALQKLRHFCAYQERSHAEAKEKLYSFGLYKTEVEDCLADLIQSDHLNEERFSIAYAGGKFRMKQWGRNKIRYALKQKQASEYCIRKALASIPDEDYGTTLKKLAEEKWETLKGEKNIFIKLRKTQDFLLQKGFEAELINQEIKALRQGG